MAGLSEQQRHLLRRRLLRAPFDDQLTARGPDILSAALPHGDCQVAVTENYLKLRLDVRRARNEWIDVRVESLDTAHAL